MSRKEISLIAAKLGIKRASGSVSDYEQLKSYIISKNIIGAEYERAISIIANFLKI